MPIISGTAFPSLTGLALPRLRIAGLGHFIFLKGGAYNAAIARMLLAISLWLTLHSVGGAYSWDEYGRMLAMWGWHPKGLVKLVDLWSNGPPPGDFVIGVYLVGKCAIILMFVGALSRLSTIVAALSTTLLASLMCSWGTYWSHAFNVQLLAALAFMFGRSGDRLSIDSLLRQLLRRPDPVPAHDGRYWWPVLFAELATHMFMWGAFFQKMRNGDGIWWALSDNLRNSLAIAWGYARFDPPALATWFMSNPWIYKAGGSLQLIAQSATIFALFLVRRPAARLILGGLFFFLEILGLTHLFRFWHPFWVPLCLLSVDWEWLWGVIRRKAPAMPADRRLPPLVRQLWVKRLAPEAARLPSSYQRVVYAFMAVFFGYYTASIVWMLGEKHLNYPFSSMAFYSENRDMPPYDVPGYFPIYRGWFELREVGGADYLRFQEVASDTLDLLLRLPDASEATMRKVHEGIRLRYTGAWFPVVGRSERVGPIADIRTYRQIVAVPPAPGPALPLVPLHQGLLSVEDAKGFRGVDPVLSWDVASQRYVVSLAHYGFRKPAFRILVRWNVRENPAETRPEALGGEWIDGRFYITNSTAADQRFLYLLIEADDPELGVKETYAGPENFQGYQ